MLQMSIDDWLADLYRPEAELKVGDRIYKIVLDVVETGIIDHMWDLGDRWGYAARRDSGCFITFWTPSIGNTVFTNREQAYSKADSLRNKYKVIRVSDMEIIKEKNFINAEGRKRIETVKLLKGNMIYFDRWPCYPFLEMFQTENKALKRFEECINEILNDINNIQKIETDESLPMQDMYLASTGKWSRYDYADFNIPIRNN